MLCTHFGFPTRTHNFNRLMSIKNWFERFLIYKYKLNLDLVWGILNAENDLHITQIVTFDIIK